MKEGNLRENAAHLSAASVAAYASGEGSPQLSQEVEEHCITCAECREQLAVVLRVCRSEISVEEQRELRPLAALGLDAAAKARQKMLTRDPATKPNDKTTGRSTHASGPRPQSPGSVPWRHRPRRWAYFPPALAVVIVMLALLGTLGYWVLQKKDSSLEQGVAALRLAFNQSPIEARVTGGFTARPQENLRGAADTKVDTDKAELARYGLLRAVDEHPSAAARHALGQLYLLRGEFDNAEKQFFQALQAAPRDAQLDAQLQADLGALYYERFKKADSSLPAAQLLLSRATEYSQKAVQLDPKLPEAWFNLALCHQQGGLRHVAKSEWEEYLKLDSTSPWAAEARKNLAELRAEETQKSRAEQGAQEEFLSAAAKGDESAMRRLVKDNFVAVQRLALVSGQLFDQSPRHHRRHLATTAREPRRQRAGAVN